MADREMFEFAAKAAGKKIDYWHSNGSPMVRGFGGTPYAWNPRDDDGDSLRLMVQLKMQVFSGCVLAPGLDMICVYNCDDEYTATRLAIFRAAVETGRAMQ